MKKLLILLLALMLTAPAVIAEEVTLSLDVLALQRANQALMDKYGHTHETLGMFDVQLDRYGEQYLITYRSNGSVPELLTGKYTALVSPEDVHVLWTHDDVDASLWQSGELTSPAWGVKQLTIWLDESPLTRYHFCDPYENALLAAQAEQVSASITVEEVTRDNRSAAEVASQLSRKAVQAMYNLPEEAINRLHWFIDLTELTRYPDGHNEWRIVLQDDVLDVLDPITYYVTIDADTMEILLVTYFVGGVG